MAPQRHARMDFGAELNSWRDATSVSKPPAPDCCRCATNPKQAARAEQPATRHRGQLRAVTTVTRGKGQQQGNSHQVPQIACVARVGTLTPDTTQRFIPSCSKPRVARALSAPPLGLSCESLLQRGVGKHSASTTEGPSRGPGNRHGNANAFRAWSSSRSRFALLRSQPSEYQHHVSLLGHALRSQLVQPHPESSAPMLPSPVLPSQSSAAKGASQSKQPRANSKQ